MKLLAGVLLIFVICAVKSEVFLKRNYEAAVPALELPHNQEILKKLYPNYELQRDKSRISNGWPAYLGQFPYQALIYMILQSGMSFCGATFIKYNWLMSVSSIKPHNFLEILKNNLT